MGLKLRKNDYVWIAGIGAAILLSEIIPNSNVLHFSGIVFIVRGILGIIVPEKKEKSK